MNYTEARQTALNMISDELKCVRCGCNDSRFLEINHKKLHKYRKRTSNIIWSILKKRVNVNKLEILCKPCNHIHYLEQKYGEEVPLKVVFEGKNGI